MAIDRDIMNRRSVPGTSMGPAGRGSITFGMDRPQTLDRLQNLFRDSRPAPMPTPLPRPMPNPRFPMPSPGPRGPMPMPMPAPRMPMPMPPPGMGPFRQQPFPDQMPRGDRFRDYMMPAAATIDPSDYRTIIKMIEQGLDPEDYIASSGIMSALPQETQMAKLNESQRQALDRRVNRFAYDEGISSPQDMLKMISPLDRPSFFGFGGNEANEQDIIDFYKNNPSMVG